MNKQNSTTMSQLEERLVKLERRVSLLREVVRTPSEGILGFVIDEDLTQEDLDAIGEIMEKTHRDIENGITISLYDFTSQLRRFDHSVSKDDPNDFAKRLLMAYGGRDQFDQVYEYMRKAGLNIPKPWG